MGSRRWISPYSPAFLAGAVALACDGSPMIEVEEPPVPDAIEEISGNDQGGIVGESLEDPLIVVVWDQHSEPMAGVDVVWEASDAGVVESAGGTDGEGRSEAVWTLGPEAGTQRAWATVDGAGSVEFVATASPAPVHECEPDEIVIERIDDEPFLWYGGEQVPLVTDSTRLVIEITAEAPVELARAALEAAGLVVDTLRVFTGATRWRLAILDPGTSLTRARDAAEAIRGDERFPFVSLAYRDPDGYIRLPVNRLVVRYHAEVDAAEIECLAVNAGMTIEGATNPYRLTFAHGAEPLSVAHWFHLHPTTDWAQWDSVCHNC